MKNITFNENQTLKLAKKYSKHFKGGEVILLQGNLGAGKTVFVKGIAQGLGIKKRITSPTFVLMKVYDVEPRIHSGIKTLIHVDAYRVELKDLINIGLEEYLNKKDAVVVIEWGEKMEKYLKKYKIKFKIIKIKILGENKRELNI
jgi:tRNA threonylcarbamoyladenosine biosynthesis protein TsaE